MIKLITMIKMLVTMIIKSIIMIKSITMIKVSITQIIG